MPCANSLILLIETPLADLSVDLSKQYDKDGEENDYRFSDQDRKYIQSPKYKGIVSKKLERYPGQLYVHVVETNKIQMTSAERARNELATKHYSGFFYTFDRTLDTFLDDKTVLQIQNNPNATHMLITHNDPYADGWMPLTPWMILHRLSHAVLDRSRFNDGTYLLQLEKLRVFLSQYSENSTVKFGSDNHFDISIRNLVVYTYI